MSFPLPQLFKYDSSVYFSKENFEKKMLEKILKTQQPQLPIYYQFPMYQFPMYQFPMYQFQMYPQFPIYSQLHKSVEKELDRQDNTNTDDLPIQKQSRKRKSTVDIEELDEEDKINELTVAKKSKISDEPIQIDNSYDDVSKEKMEDVIDVDEIKIKKKLQISYEPIQIDNSEDDFSKEDEKDEKDESYLNNCGGGTLILDKFFLKY